MLVNDFCWALLPSLSTLEVRTHFFFYDRKAETIGQRVLCGINDLFSPFFSYRWAGGDGAGGKV